MRVKVTAKVKAVTPDPSSQYMLLEFLKAYRDWAQYVINEIWNLDHIPSMKELHDKFYKTLRQQGFRAHHCHKIERRAKEVVKAVKKNKGSKPVLRKLTARLDYQDYRLDRENRTLRITVLNHEWVELRPLWCSYLSKYFSNSWKLKEIVVSYRNNEIWVYLTFEKKVEPRKPKTVMGIDVNFDNVTYTIIDLHGNLVTMGVIPFNGLKRALARKVIAEKLQRRHSRKWRYIRGIREAIKKHGRRARNILVDSCHYISRRIVEIAKEYDALIALEDLNKLRNRANGSRKYNKKLSLWAYRRIQSYIHYKALIEEAYIVHVNPRGTSKTSPIGGKLVFISYRWVKLPNEHIITRDIIASWNLALRGLKLLTRDVGLRGFMEAPKAPKPDANPRRDEGKPMQASKIPLVSKR